MKQQRSFEVCYKKKKESVFHPAARFEILLDPDVSLSSPNNFLFCKTDCQIPIKQLNDLKIFRSLVEFTSSPDSEQRRKRIYAQTGVNSFDESTELWTMIDECVRSTIIWRASLWSLDRAIVDEKKENDQVNRENESTSSWSSWRN